MSAIGKPRTPSAEVPSRQCLPHQYKEAVSAVVAPRFQQARSSPHSPAPSPARRFEPSEEWRMSPTASEVNADGATLTNRQLRIAFLTPMPSPYVQDLFEAMQQDGRVMVRVFYMEMAAPDTHWGDARLPSYASILPGTAFQALGIRI